MELIKGNVLYVSGCDAENIFFATPAKLGLFRRQGMPFELIKNISPDAHTTPNEKYCYPVKKCQRWFAGEIVR